MGTLKQLGNLTARPRSANGGANALRGSPIPPTGSDELFAAPGRNSVAAQPWTVALAQADAKLTTYSVQYASGGRSSVGSSHRRTPSGGDGRPTPHRPCSKVSSVASSMVSLDSNVVD